MYALGAVLLYGCTGRVPAGTSDFSFTHSNFHEKVALTGEDMSIGISQPCDVKYHPAGYLIFSDQSGGRLLKVVELSSGCTQTLLSRGRAADEVLSVKDIAVTYNGFWVSSPQDRKLVRYLFDPAERVFVQKEVVQAGAQFLRAIPFREGMFLLEASASSCQRFLIANARGVIVDTLGTFPKLNSGPANNAVFQSAIAVGPDKESFVAAYASVDVIDIYDAANQLHRMIGPDQESFEIRTRNTPLGTQYSVFPKKNAYSGTSFTSSSIFVGRIGVSLREDEDYLRGISSILQFSPAGRPERELSLSQELVSFDVDEKGGCLYGVSNDPEPVVYVFRYGQK